MRSVVKMKKDEKGNYVLTLSEGELQTIMACLDSVKEGYGDEGAYSDVPPLWLKMCKAINKING